MTTTVYYFVALAMMLVAIAGERARSNARASDAT